MFLLLETGGGKWTLGGLSTAGMHGGMALKDKWRACTLQIALPFLQLPEVRLCLRQSFFSSNQCFCSCWPRVLSCLDLERIPPIPNCLLTPPALSASLIRQCLKPCRTCILMSFISLSSSRYGTGFIFSGIMVQNYCPEPKINGDREVTVVNSPLCWGHLSLKGTENAQWLRGFAAWRSNTYWMKVQSTD